jgi:hypothetical protein
MAHAHTCPLLQNLPRPFVPSAALTIAELTILYPFSASLVCRVASLLSVAAGAPREHRCARRQGQRDAECGGDKGGAERNRERKVPRGLDSSVEQQSIRNQIRVLRMQISANTDNATRVEQIGAKIRLELELEQMERV